MRRTTAAFSNGGGDLAQVQAALTESHRQLSVVLEVQGDLEGALDHHRQALELLGPDGEGRLRSWILNGLGWYHSLLGRHREALVFCAAALELARTHDDDYTLGHVLNSIEHARHHLGAHDEAVSALEEAPACFRRVGGVPWAEAHTLASLADSRLSLGQPDRARALLGGGADSRPARASGLRSDARETGRPVAVGTQGGAGRANLAASVHLLVPAVGTLTRTTGPYGRGFYHPNGRYRTVTSRRGGPDCLPE